MQKNAEGYDVTLLNDSERWGQLALQGPDAEAMLKKVLGVDASEMKFYNFKDYMIEGQRVIISRTGYTGEDGFEIYATTGQTVKFWVRLPRRGRSALRTWLSRHPAL